MEPKIEINFNRDDIKLIAELVEQLKIYNSNQQNINYNFNFQCDNFVGSKQEAKSFAELIRRYLDENEGRN
jgi:hypothetical protein